MTFNHFRLISEHTCTLGQEGWFMERQLARAK